MNNKDTAPIDKMEEGSRRDFLIKAGKMAIYVPPAVMVLMSPGRNALGCSFRPPQKFPPKTSSYKPRRPRRRS